MSELVRSLLISQNKLKRTNSTLAESKTKDLKRSIDLKDTISHDGLNTIEIKVNDEKLTELNQKVKSQVNTLKSTRRSSVPIQTMETDDNLFSEYKPVVYSGLISVIFDAYNKQFSSYLKTNAKTLKKHGQRSMECLLEYDKLNEKKRKEIYKVKNHVNYNDNLNFKHLKNLFQDKLCHKNTELLPLPNKVAYAKFDENENKKFYNCERSTVAIRKKEYVNSKKLNSGKRINFHDQKNQNILVNKTNNKIVSYVLKIQSTWKKYIIRKKVKFYLEYLKSKKKGLGILRRKYNKFCKKIFFDKLKTRSKNSKKFYYDYLNLVQVEKVVAKYNDLIRKYLKQNREKILKRLKFNKLMKDIIYKAKQYKRNLLKALFNKLKLKSKYISNCVNIIKKIVIFRKSRKIISNNFKKWVLLDSKKKKSQEKIMKYGKYLNFIEIISKLKSIKTRLRAIDLVETIQANISIFYFRKYFENTLRALIGKSVHNRIHYNKIKNQEIQLNSLKKLKNLFFKNLSYNFCENGLSVKRNDGKYIRNIYSYLWYEQKIDKNKGLNEFVIFHRNLREFIPETQYVCEDCENKGSYCLKCNNFKNSDQENNKFEEFFSDLARKKSLLLNLKKGKEKKKFSLFNIDKIFDKISDDKEKNKGVISHILNEINEETKENNLFASQTLSNKSNISTQNHLRNVKIPAQEANKRKITLRGNNIDEF